MSPAEPPAPDTSCASTSLAAPPARAVYGAGCEENEGLRTRGHAQATHAASEISSTRVCGSAPIRRFLLALPPSEGLRARATWRAWSWACLLPVSGKGSAPGEPRVRTCRIASAQKALHRGRQTWTAICEGHACEAGSPHQQPPGMLQRRLPAGPLSAFSTLLRRRIDVAFTWLQRAGLVRQVRTPLGSSKPEARPSLPVFCTSLQSFTPPKHDVVASRHVTRTPCFNCENKSVF
ncbi:uncharacterized protein LOC144153951 isoform X2 [Haemaphysalis longicornis]